MTKDEENFEEAVVAVNSCFAGGKPTDSLIKILDDESCHNLTKEVGTTQRIALHRLNFYVSRVNYFGYSCGRLKIS